MKMILVYFLLLFNLGKAQNFMEVIAGKTAGKIAVVVDDPNTGTYTGVGYGEVQTTSLAMTKGIVALYAGDGDVATETQLTALKGVFASADGRIYISESDAFRIKVIGTNGLITTFAGTDQTSMNGITA
jgi:hypothetical protein